MAFEWDQPTAAEIEKSNQFKRQRRAPSAPTGPGISAEELLKNQQQLAELRSLLVQLNEKVDVLLSSELK